MFYSDTQVFRVASVSARPVSCWFVVGFYARGRSVLCCVGLASARGLVCSAHRLHACLSLQWPLRVFPSRCLSLGSC